MKSQFFGVKLGIILSLILAMPVYAQGGGKPIDVTVPMKTVVSNANTSRMMGTPRGRVLSSGEVELANDNDGIFYVYGDTLCHSAVKDIYMTIYLEIWDEELDDWGTLNMYEYEWHATTVEEDLHSAGVSFEIHNLQKGREYRIRGTHSANSFEDYFEIMSTETGAMTLN